MTRVARILIIPLAMVTVLTTDAFAVGGDTAVPFLVSYRCPLADANGESTCVPKLNSGAMVMQYVQIRTISDGNAQGVVKFTEGSYPRRVYLPTTAMHANGQTYLERNAPIYFHSLISITVYGATPNSEVYVELTGVQMI